MMWAVGLKYCKPNNLRIEQHLFYYIFFIYDSIFIDTGEGGLVRLITWEPNFNIQIISSYICKRILVHRSQQIHVF